MALVLTPRADDLELLLIRRAARVGDPWSGQIAFPGGRFESSDDSLFHTAVRETREETALDLSGARVLGELDELRPRTPVLPPIIVRPYVLAVPSRPVLVPNEEVAEVFWVGLRHLFDPANVIRTTVDARGTPMEVDAVEVGGRVVWGMTERILRGLKSVYI